MNQESRNTGKSGTIVPDALSEARAIGSIAASRSYIPVFLIDLYV